MEYSSELNEFYSHLTHIDGQENTDNFLASLRFKRNGYTLINILSKLNCEFTIKEGFIDYKIRMDDYANRFKSVIIEVQDVNYVISVLEQVEEELSVNLINETTMQILNEGW